MAQTEITYPDKVTGNQFTGAEATEVKSVVNANAQDAQAQLDAKAEATELSEADARLLRLENNVGILTLKSAITSGWTVFEMSGGFADEFENESGVDLALTTMEYLPAEDAYRTELGTVVLIQSINEVDGSTSISDATGNTTVTFEGTADHDTSQYKFDSSSMVMVGSSANRVNIANSPELDFLSDGENWTIEGFFYSSDFSTRTLWSTFHNTDLQFNLSEIGTYGLRFSYSENGGSIVNLDSANSILTNSTWHHVAVCREVDNLRVYLDGVQVAIGDVTGKVFRDTSGDFYVGGRPSSSGGGTLQGFVEEFRISNVCKYSGGVSFTPPTSSFSLGAASELISKPFTAASQPSSARANIVYEDRSGDSALNTDIEAFISRDGGTTFTKLTLSEEAVYSGDVNVLAADVGDISAQPDGTSMVFKLKASSKVQYIYGIYPQWL